MLPVNSTTRDLIDCGETLRLASDFLEGELLLPEAAAVAAHLTACTCCARQFAELAVTITALRQLGPRLHLTNERFGGWRQ